MKTKEEHAVRREASVTKMGAQLDAWSTQIDGLVAGCVSAGAATHDPYRARIDGLKDRLAVVEAKFKEFNSPAAVAPPFGAFRSEVASDWNALEAGFKDLTQDAVVASVPAAA